MYFTEEEYFLTIEAGWFAVGFRTVWYSLICGTFVPVCWANATLFLLKHCHISAVCPRLAVVIILTKLCHHQMWACEHHQKPKHSHKSSETKRSDVSKIFVHCSWYLTISVVCSCFFQFQQIRCFLRGKLALIVLVWFAWNTARSRSLSCMVIAIMLKIFCGCIRSI